MSLVLNDPLADQQILITILLPESDAPRDARPLILSIGVEGETPVVQAGQYADISNIIEQAWTAYSVAHPTPTAATAVGAETIVAAEETPPPPPPATQAVNLSLF